MWLVVGSQGGRLLWFYRPSAGHWRPGQNKMMSTLTDDALITTGTVLAAERTLIMASAVFAAEAHATQVRKELNEPYIVHPLRVGKMGAELGMDAEFIAACHLHDVVEDTPIPMAAIEQLFPPRTVALVKAVTKWWQSGHAAEVLAANKAAYYAQIVATADAPLLKIIDRVDNLYDFAKMARRAAPMAHKWAAKYHAKTLSEFAPLLAVLPADHRAHKYFAAALSALEVAL